MSNYDDDHYCMNCLPSFETKEFLRKKLNSHENACKSSDYCRIVMLEEGKNILKI